MNYVIVYDKEENAKKDCPPNGKVESISSIEELIKQIEKQLREVAIVQPDRKPGKVTGKRRY